MPRYIVATTDDDDEHDFVIGTILGIKEAESPEIAIIKCCYDALDKEFVEDAEFADDSVINMTRWVLEEAADEGEPIEFEAFEVKEKFSQSELDIPTKSRTDTKGVRLDR